MPELDPVYYDAIDRVIEEKDPNAEWDNEEMRNALIETIKGTSQQDAAEGRGFAQPVLSRRLSDLEEYKEEIEDDLKNGSGLFKDPVEEAIDDFESFFSRMNDKYDMGINSRVVQMMVDEIRDARQLPQATFVNSFLKSTKSGVSGADIDYITRRYRNWLRDHSGVESNSGGQQTPNMSMGGGQQIGDRQSPNGGMQGGVPVGGGQQQTGTIGGGQQRSGGQQAPRDPRVDRLEEKLDRLIEGGGGGSGGSSDSQMVRIEREDGSTVELPVDHPAAMKMLGGDDDGDDFLSMLSKAKEAGLIPDPSDFQDNGDGGDDLGDAFVDAIEKLGERQVQAQQQMSQNMSQIMSEVKEMQNTSDEELTVEKVDQIIEDKMTKSEVDQLREEFSRELDELKSEVVEKRRTPAQSEPDHETIQTEREYDYKERQLEAMNRNMRELPQAVSESVRDSFIPLVSMLREGGGQAWSPENATGRGEPDFAPGGFDEDQRQQQQQRRQQQQQQQQERRREAAERQPRQQTQEAPQEGYPSTEEQPQQEESGGGVDEDEVNNIRDKIGLDGDDGQQEAGA